MTAVQQWQTTVAQLHIHTKKVRADLANLEVARRPLALAAKTGSADAQTRLNEITRQQRDCEREIADLAIAIEEAGAKLGEAQREAEAAHRAKRRAEALVLVDKRVNLAERIDELLRGLSATYEEFNEVGIALGQYRDAHGLDDSDIHRPPALGYALKHADPGLNRQLDVRAQAALPLASWEQDLWARFRG